MAEQQPSPSNPSDGMSVGWGDKKATVTGQHGLILFLVAALIAMAFYVVEVKTERLDQALAKHAQDSAVSDEQHRQHVAQFVALETKRGEALEELLRLTNRHTAALEVLAGRVGSYLRPQEEYQNRLRREGSEGK